MNIQNQYKVKRGIWTPEILLAGGRSRKLLRCKQVLHFWKKEDGLGDGVKSQGDFFLGLHI